MYMEHLPLGKKNITTKTHVVVLRWKCIQEFKARHQTTPAGRRYVPGEGPYTNLTNQ